MRALPAGKQIIQGRDEAGRPEWDMFYDGRYLGTRRSERQATDELDAYVYEVLRDDLVTRADEAAEAAAWLEVV